MASKTTCKICKGLLNNTRLPDPLVGIVNNYQKDPITPIAIDYIKQFLEFLDINIQSINIEYVAKSHNLNILLRKLIKTWDYCIQKHGIIKAEQLKEQKVWEDNKVEISFGPELYEYIPLLHDMIKGFQYLVRIGDYEHYIVLTKLEFDFKIKLLQTTGRALE